MQKMDTADRSLTSMAVKFVFKNNQNTLANQIFESFME